MRKKSILAIAALAGFLSAGLALYRSRRLLIARALKLPPARYPITVEKDLLVPVGEGRTLLANHYFPKAAEQFPTVLIRSPWGRGLEAPPFSLLYWFLAGVFAERGYHVVVQNTRVRSDEEGRLFPWGEDQDGLATLDWINHQPWFNGRLGMWGTSYLGYVQWAAAVDAPDYLQALVPGTTSSNWRSFFYQDKALALERILRTLSLVHSANLSFREMLSGGKAAEEAYDEAIHHLPLVEADRVLIGVADVSFRSAVAHPDAADPFWLPLQHRDSLGRIKAAVHLVGGWYDVFLKETLADYQELAGAGHQPYLTIGPYSHTNPEAGWESLRAGLTWFEAILKDRREQLSRQPVCVYLMGANEWREYPTWPPASRQERLALQGGGVLVTPELVSDATPDHYRYHPEDPTPSVGGALIGAQSGAVDDGELERRGDTFCYTSAVLSANQDIIGAPKLELYVRSSNPYTDFFGRLCDVDPEGRSTSVCDGFCRLTPGEGEAQSDGTIKVQFELGPTAYRWAAGHLMRLVVASGAHPRWNRNLGTGDDTGQSTEMCIAELAIYHDAEHPSAVILPRMEQGTPP